MESHKKTIGASIYVVKEMDGLRALKTEVKLVKILGPSIIPFIGNAIQNGLKKIDPNMIPDLAAHLITNFDDELIIEVVLSLFETDIFIEKKGHVFAFDFNTHFQGKVAEMWKVVAFILEANFSLGEFIVSHSDTGEEEKEEDAKTS